MRVARIRVSNVMGIEELEIDNPGSITTVEARNGKGKTSLIEAIRSVVDGGHDATLLRNGADVGEVVLVLDDETEIRKRITADGSKLTVTRPDIGEVSSPKRFVDRLFNALSVNPVAFLALPEKEQAQALLEALPLKLDRGDVENVVADLIPIRDSDFRGHPLDVLEGIHRRVYDERTGINRASKEKKATVDQLTKSLPTDASETDPEQQLDVAMQAQSELQRVRQERLDALQDEVDENVQRLRDDAHARIREIEQQLSLAIETTQRGHQDLVQRVTAEYQPQLEELAGLIGSLRQQSRTAAAANNTRQVLTRLSEEVDSLTEKSQALTGALDALDGLKLSLLKGLPIKGLEVRDGILYKGDVPFRRLNKAEQVKVAIRLAQLRAGDVPLVCVDGIEALDGPTFQAFREHASKTDLQFIVTRVTPETEHAPQGLHVMKEAIPA